MLRSVLRSAEPHVPDGVRFTDLGDRLQLTATADFVGLATKWFAEPAVYVSFDPDSWAAPGTRLLGYAFTQFAMPVRAELPGRFDFNPSPTLSAQPVVLPLLLERPDGTVCLLAPLDSWHEQIVAVTQDDDCITGLRWGWHGDLDRVEADFTTTLGIYEGRSATELLRAWGSEIRAKAGTSTRRLGPDADPVVTHLSYWTDNGAAYWYRTEPGLDLPATLERKLTELRELGVAIGAVELDSWFYPHEISRTVTDIGYLEEVPPTGMLEWAPRPDVLPDGVDGLADRLGRPPLVLHSRHISPNSPYVTEAGDDEDWWVELVAHPADPGFFRRWFDDAAAWGATCIEQDWMLLYWFGARQLRETPGRAMAWLRGLDQAAAATGLTLMWCMPTPADLMATVELERVVATRTSDDYRYAADPALLWHWYLTVNRLAEALDLPAFKDCFFTAATPATPGSTDEAGRDQLDGDPHPEVEALLSAMSAGAAGIGDRIGRTDVAIVERLCRPDGVLVKPDRPLALADQSLFGPPEDPDRLCWATASSGRWHYVVALHTGPSASSVRDSFPLTAVDNPGTTERPGTDTSTGTGTDTATASQQQHDWLVYDWRQQTAEPASQTGAIEAELGWRHWGLWICCPIEPGPDGTRQALVGDPARYATMGASRVAHDDHRQPRAVLADGEESVPLRWWREDTGLFDR